MLLRGVPSPRWTADAADPESSVGAAENRETCVVLACRGHRPTGLDRPPHLVSLLFDLRAAVSVPGRLGVSDPEVVDSRHNNMMHEVNGSCASALAR